jgi:chromosome segregation ATPase
MLRVGLGAFFGAAAGVFAAAGWLLITGGASFVATALTVLTLIGVGGVGGAVAGFLWAKRVPPMLPHYREEHLRLRQMAQQIRTNLQQMTGVKSAYPELDEILAKDADLRQKATKLRLQIERQAKRGLSWQDHLSVALEALREGTLGSFKRSEWVWRAYRAKLERELNAIGRKLDHNRDGHMENTLQRAYRQKARELASFRNLERTLQTLENESAMITASVENLLMETIRLSAAPRSATPRTDALLEPLRKQIQAYEQALDEIYRAPQEDETETAWLRS